MVKCIFTAFSILPCLLCSIGFAQGNRHMKWTYNITPLSVNEVLITLVANVEPTWHLYSQNLKEGGPLPTRFKFASSDEYLLIGDAKESGKPTTFYDDLYEMEITWYSGTVDFIQRVKVNGSTTIKGKVEYMICNNEICIPSKHEFNINVNPWIKTP